MWTENVFYGFLYLVSGCCIGSFLNICIWRLPRESSPVTGRFSCGRCGHVLGPFDMIPVASWLLLKGRCRCCGRPISPRLPATEALTGGMFLLCCHVFGPGLRSALACLFCAALITAAWIDWDWMYVPDMIPLVILATGILSLITALSLPGRLSWDILFDRLAGAGVTAACMISISLLTGGGIGGGDIKLMAASAFYLGFSRILLAFFLGYVLAALWVIPRYLRGRLKRRDPVPMIPFFAVSLMISLLWGGRLIYWYMSLLFSSP